jgi:hypothetical protein
MRDKLKERFKAYRVKNRSSLMKLSKEQPDKENTDPNAKLLHAASAKYTPKRKSSGKKLSSANKNSTPSDVNDVESS